MTKKNGTGLVRLMPHAKHPVCLLLCLLLIGVRAQTSTHHPEKAISTQAIQPGDKTASDPRRAVQTSRISAAVFGYVHLAPRQNLLFTPSQDPRPNKENARETSASFCLFSNDPEGGYTLEAMTDTQDFRLRGPGPALEYTLFWQRLGQQAPAGRVPLRLAQPLHLTGAETAHLDCAGKRNVRLIVALRHATAAGRARTAQYGSVLTLVIGQE